MSVDRDEVLYQNERTLIFRRYFAGGTGSIICKRPLGPKAGVRLQHERRILERLAGIAGMQQLATTATPPSGVIALEDRQLRSLTDAFPDKPLPLTQFLALALPLADLIAALHRAGIVHKDLSPANIVFGGAEQTPSLIDFDLATTFAEERPGFIQPQDIAGTLAYMSPEQTGRTGRPVDHRTDLYALGAILYELALGHPPFDNHYSDPLHLIHEILAKVPVAPCDLDKRVPPALSDILLRLLEKEPDRRYQSAEGLKVDLLQLRDRLATGDNARFPLGTHDYPLRLLPPSQLVGRDAEIAMLQATFDSTLQGKSRGVMVTGAPGVGKSALINELRPIVTARRGWFVAGKFDQFRQDVSADAVGQALRGLIRLMLAESETELALLRQRVLQELGPNAGLMATVLPEFAQSFGLTPEIISGDPTQTAKRMIQAALGLVRAIASRQRPVVMVIDDLQWVSASSLDFIDAVLTDDRLRGVLLVASYRDNEVDATHPLTAMLSRWERLKVAPALLPLNNLPPDDVATLLAAMLRLPAEQAQQLAQAVGARTHGNPFDTVELVNALRQDGALTLGESGWQWDSTTIRRYVGKGEVIDLLAARIARLSVAGRLLLESMACLGNEVSLDLLAVASGVSSEELDAQLESALEDGLLVLESTSNTLRFRHDRVQQAAYGSLDPELRTVLHLAIARRLAAHDDFKTMAAEQYLAAVEAIESAEERERVIELFQAAAIHARQASSYVVAEKLASAALQLLDRMPTSTANEVAPLFASLQTELHLALYCQGRLEEADEVYSTVEKQCTDPLTLANAACIQISSMTNRNQMQEGLTLGLDLIQRLGLPVPQTEELGAAIGQGMDALSRWTTESDQSVETTRLELKDARVLALAKLLYKMQTPAFVSNPMMYAWQALQCHRLWVEHGPCTDLMNGLSSAPMLFIAMRQDYRSAYNSARKVIAISEARGYQAATSYASYVFEYCQAHWFEPLEDGTEYVQRAREGLLRDGNLQIAGYTYYVSIIASFECTPTLNACAEEIETGFAFATRTGNDYALTELLPYQQILRALRGETESADSFNDADFDESKHLDSVANSPKVYFHTLRALSAVLLGDRRTLATHAAAAMSLLASTPGFYINAQTYLLHSLSLCEQLKSSTAEDRTGLLAEFDVCREWLSARAADAPMNFQHLSTWLAAERAWATGDAMDAMTAFDTALAEVALQQRPWHHALITERAGLCHLTHGLAHSGQLLLAEARDLYDAWGASAKVAHLTRQYPFLRAASGVTHPGHDGSHMVRSSQTSSHGSHRSSHHSGTTSISATSLDLLSILRASQALSSETHLAGLRVRIETLLRELTGATHLTGAMWYEDRQEWCMTVQGESLPVAVEAAGQRSLLPLSAFHYVMRTREPLLVDDALRDDRFANDPYFKDIPCCSLLGVPVFNHGILRTVFLLENRLSHGAFTADRLDAMLLIAGQLAISIDNALLYDSLERKVAERTQALEAANQRLAALSITDALTKLANRRRFDEVFASEWQRAIRPQTSLAVAMIDIDQFKLYNDHYGHQGGDECLRKVAAVLKDTVRGEADLVARYGGEEFVIVLPGADLDAMQVVAERARAAVEALQEPHEKAGHAIVTISLGISALIPTAEAHPESLIELADAALYRAKKNGRNQVVGSRPIEA